MRITRGNGIRTFGNAQLGSALAVAACCMILAGCGSDDTVDIGGSPFGGAEISAGGYVVGEALSDGPQAQACLSSWNDGGAPEGDEAGGEAARLLAADDHMVYGDGDIYLASMGDGDQCLLTYLGSHLDLSKDMSYQMQQWRLGPNGDVSPLPDPPGLTSTPEDIETGLRLTYVDDESRDGRLAASAP